METGFLNFESFTTDFYDPDSNNAFDGAFTDFGSEIDRMDNFSSVYYNPQGVQRIEKAEDFQKTIQDWDRHVDLQSLSVESEMSPDCAVKDEPSYELPNLFFSPLDEIKIEPLPIDFDEINTVGEISDIDDLLKEEPIHDFLQDAVPCDTASSPSNTKPLPSKVPEKYKKPKRKFQNLSLVVKIKLTDEIKQMLRNDGHIPQLSEEAVSQNEESAKSDDNCDIKEVIHVIPRDIQQGQKETNADEVDIEEGEISSESDNDDKKDVKEETQIEESNKPKKKLNLEEYRSRMKNMERSKTPDRNVKNELKTEIVSRSTYDIRKRNYRRVSDSSSLSSYSSRSRRSRTRSPSKRSYRSSSRSRSRSRSSRSYSSSSRSRSRSRNRRSRRGSSSRSRVSYRRARISPERYARRLEEWSPVDRLKQVEERRVVYVGKIPDGTTKAHLRERFDQFGPIVDITLHLRERNNNYGFVTFVSKSDAYFAVEHGNDKQDVKYEICFGGRRVFCKQKYHDLDGAPVYNQQQMKPINSYEQLLKKAQEKIKNKKV